jgi:hypothetical protein
MPVTQLPYALERLRDFEAREPSATKDRIA